MHMASVVKRPPRIFHVNWFRQNDAGQFIWPGFGENLRALRWIVERCEGRGAAAESPIGLLPAMGAIDTDGLNVDDATMNELLTVSKDDWHKDKDNIAEFFGKFGARLPGEMGRQLDALGKRLG